MLRLWGERPSHRVAGGVGLVTSIFVLAVAAGDLVLTPLIRFRIATLVAVAVAVLAVWAARSARWRARVPLSLVVLAGLSLTALPVALLRAPDPAAGRSEVFGFVAGVAVACAVTALARGTEFGLVAIRRGWALGLALSIGVAVVELLSGHHFGIGSGLAWAEQSRTIIAGAFRNPNDFAIALAAMMSGTLAYASGHRARVRTLLMVLVVLGAVAVALTQSRSGMLALVFVLLVHAWSMVQRRGVERGSLRGAGWRLSRRGAVTAAGVCAVAMAATVWIPALAARNPVLTMVTSATEPGTARSDQLRLDLLRAAVRYAGESDGLGTGAASFEVLLARDAHPGVAVRTWLHNSFLELLLQYGVPVSAALIGVIGVVLFACFRPRASHPRRSLAQAEAVSALITFVALGCASASVLTTPIWWLMLGQAVTSGWWLSTPPVSQGRDMSSSHLQAS